MFAVYLFLLLSLPGYSTIRYVKAGNASPAVPYISWATASDSVQKVVDICENGDTIIIGTGIYRELVRSERNDITLTFIGTDVDSCIFDLSGYPPETEYISIFIKHSIKVENLRFTTTTNDANKHTAIFSGSSPFPITVNVRNCHFSNLRECIDLSKVNGDITGNYFYNVTRAVLNTLRPAGEYMQIYNNTIIRSGGTAIVCHYGTIRNNWILMRQGTGIGGNSLFGSGQQIYNNLVVLLHPLTNHFGLGSVEGTIRNNVILNTGVGIQAIKSEIKNNIISNCSLEAIRFNISSHAQNCDINYNTFYLNKRISNNLSIFNPDTTIYYTADPMFENQDSNNFLLQMFSPLIDAGDPNILDVDGTRSDVGLYGGPYGQSYEYKDLPPKKPKVISTTKLKNKVNFQWRGGTEADFNSFSLYRSRDPQFVPNNNNKIFSGIDTLFTDSIQDPTGSYIYKLIAKDNQGNVSKLDSVTVVLTSVSDESESPTPERIYLYKNYPNPFNPSTKIKFSLTDESEVILRVYDVNGELVTMLQNGWLPAGEYEREFSPTAIGTIKDIASGVYFYNLLVRDKNLTPLFVKTEKMLFIK
ncbi:hypothetical protein MASR2M39_18510 [Ignavibacteriales bacterium]